MEDNSELASQLQALTMEYFEEAFKKYPTEIPYYEWHKLYLSFKTMVQKELCSLEDILHIAETLGAAQLSDETENYINYLPEKIEIEESAYRIRRGLSQKN